MRRVNARITNSCLWILLLHLSPTSALSDALITRLRTDGAEYESQSDFRERRISASNQVRCR